MSILGRFDVRKLEIHAYKRRNRRRPPVSKFTAMYNPDSVTQSYQNQYSQKRPLGRNHGVSGFVGIGIPRLELKLILDTTWADSLQTPSQSVKDRVQSFLETAYRIDGSIHSPRHLTVFWGGLTFWGESSFKCVLSELIVTYQSFQRDGSPLRAELTVTLVGDEDPVQAARRTNAQSPDITHHHVVRHGDTLPLLCRDIYGDSRYYLYVAEANGLDNFRTLQPGQTLYFPPLDTQ